MGRNGEKVVLNHRQTLFFVAMDALVRIYDDALIAKSNVTAMKYPLRV